MQRALVRLPHDQTKINRRSEPRYLVAKEDVVVWDLHRIKAGSHVATIIDMSRNGMRLESTGRFAQGRHIAVDFRGMIISGTVQYCRALQTRFVMGIRIRDVLVENPRKPERHSGMNSHGVPG